MMSDLKKLLSLASEQLCETITVQVENGSDTLLEQLYNMLKEKNGFYAFESALHVFPSDSSNGEIGVVEWNEISLWKEEYNNDLSNVIFFAEDIFGNQFCIKDDIICFFDPEMMSFEF